MDLGGETMNNWDNKPRDLTTGAPQENYPWCQLPVAACCFPETVDPEKDTYHPICVNVNNNKPHILMVYTLW